jgi:hypothetical protein
MIFRAHHRHGPVDLRIVQFRLRDITAWVEQNITKKDVGGTTVYEKRALGASVGRRAELGPELQPTLGACRRLWRPPRPPRYPRPGHCVPNRAKV